MYADAQADDLKAATDTAISMWGTSSEDEIRAKLEAAGYDATTISDAIAKAKGGEISDNEMDATLRQQEHDEAVSTGTELVAGMYTGLESEESIRTKLAEAGYSDAVINDILDKEADEYYTDLARQNGIDEETYERDYNDAMELAINEYNRGTSLDEIRNQLNALPYNSVAVDAVMRLFQQRKEEDDYKALEEYVASEWTNADSEAKIRDALANETIVYKDENGNEVKVKKYNYSDAMIDKVITEQKKRYWANLEADNGMREEEYEQQKYEAGQAAQNLVGKTKDDGTVYTMADIRAELESKYGRGVVEPVMEELMKTEAAKIIENEWKSVEDTERLLSMLKAQGYSASVLMPLLREREDLYYADLARANGITEQTYQRDLNTGREIAAEMYGTEKDLDKIRDALVDAGLNDVAIEAVMSEYTEKKDEDDAKAATDDAALWYSQGLSPEEIRAKLTEQGYRPAVIDELVSYYTDRQAQDEARAEEVAEKEATNYVTGHFASLDDEADVRSYLQSQFNEDGSRKYSDAMIEKVMTARKEQYWSNLASNRGIREEEYKGQVSEATTLANSLIGRTKEDGSSYTMAEIRDELSKNYDYTVVEPIMEKIMETEAAKYVADNWKDSSSEAQISADMLANGYSLSAINAALRNQRLQYWDDMRVANGMREEEYNQDVYEAGQIAQNLVGQNYSMAQIRADLLKEYDESVVGPIMDSIMETEAAKYVAANWKGIATEDELRESMLASGYSEAAVDAALFNHKNNVLAKGEQDQAFRDQQYNAAATDAEKYLADGMTPDEIRDKLDDSYDAGVVEEIMGTIGEIEASKEDAHEEYIQKWYAAASNKWDGTNEAKLRSMLKNQNVSEEDADTIINMLKADDVAHIKDLYTTFEKNPTVTGAAELVKEMKAKGNDEYLQKVSSNLKKSFDSAIKNLSTGYKILGVDETEWNDMEDDERDGLLVDSVCEAYKNGSLSWDDCNDILSKKARDELGTIYASNKVGIFKIKDVLDTVNGILLLEDQGKIGDGMAKSIMDEMAKTETAKFVHDNYHESDSHKNPFLTTGTSSYLSKTQEEAYYELIGAMYRTGVLKNEIADEVWNDITDRFKP